MPRASSTVSEKPHVFVPERSFQPSSSHVSWPTSPGRGTVWKSHSFLPVTASNARVSPGGPIGSFVDARADHDDVLVDRRRAAVADHHVDLAVGPESFRRLAGRRVERRAGCRARRDDDALGRVAIAGEVADAAARHCAACGRRARHAARSPCRCRPRARRRCCRRGDTSRRRRQSARLRTRRRDRRRPASASRRRRKLVRPRLARASRRCSVLISVSGEKRVPARSWL